MNEHSHPGALPTYIQVSEMLIRRIAAGQLADGARLPPERTFARGLGISVGTLRKSLAELAEKNLLERIQGSGNYVRHRPDVASLYTFFRLEKVGGGGMPTAEALTVDRLAKPATAPDFGASAEGHRIRRLRRLDGDVGALEEVWLDGDQTPKLAVSDLSESLYHFYRTQLGLVIARVQDRVGIAPIPDWAPTGFHMARGQVAGYIERVSHSQNAQAVEFSRTWFDSERAAYVSRMGRV